MLCFSACKSHLPQKNLLKKKIMIGTLKIRLNMYMSWCSIGTHHSNFPSGKPWELIFSTAGYTWTRMHPWPNEVGLSWVCCPGIVWEPIRKTSSHATRCETLGHNRLSSLSHCGLILAQNRSGIDVCELISTLHFTKNAEVGSESSNLPPKSSQARKEPL